MNPRDFPLNRPAIIWISEKYLTVHLFPGEILLKRSADLAKTRNTNFFNSISNKFEKSKSGWLEEMGGPTGWQLATQRVHKITRERGNESVDELCVSPARSQTFFSFFFSNQLESSAKKSKSKKSKNVLQTIFPGEKRRASTCVESWREFKNTFRRRPSFSSSPLISCRQIWNWIRKIVSSSSSSDGINNFFGKKFRERNTMHLRWQQSRLTFWRTRERGTCGPLFSSLPSSYGRTVYTLRGYYYTMHVRLRRRTLFLSLSLFFFQARRAIV